MLAHTWLQQSSPGLDLTAITTARHHFSRTGWDTDITIGRERATSLTLPQLLADGCLDGIVLDLMAEYTQTEVTYDKPVGLCQEIVFCFELFHLFF
jgi:hypothetical protein